VNTAMSMARLSSIEIRDENNFKEVVIAWFKVTSVITCFFQQISLFIYFGLFTTTIGHIIYRVKLQIDLECSALI
jgi:hypothetical protein